MHTIKTLFPILLTAVILSACGGEKEQKESQKIGFMENGPVFEKFQMKLDYDKLMEKDIKDESERLDSLLIFINSYTGDEIELQKYKKNYYAAQQVYQQKFEELSTRYTGEVNDRLNTYIEAFAKEKGYSLILGSLGQGNVMYADDKDNVTKDLIEFVNKKYNK